jgi:2-keto-4-pentenoate hydratase/2-oxohepta-3-ene-1,7-dioic acid hydratase in catechol pathway
MKLLSFSAKGEHQVRLGFLLQNRVLDVLKVAKWMELTEKASMYVQIPRSMRGILENWEKTFSLLKNMAERLKEQEVEQIHIHNESIIYRPEEISYYPPLLNPPSFRDFYAFEQHVKTSRSFRNLEMISEWYEFPVFYFSNPNAFLGHKMPLKVPPYTEELDYELEMACIIGKEGKDIPIDEAPDYIAGYSILNDWSARDIQRREMRVGLGPAKGKDFATSLGPYLVTVDELEGLEKNKGFDLTMTAKKNDRLLSKGNFSDITYSFAEMIVWASQGVTLYPGDVFGSGTVGTGCILELRPENTGGWLKSGDIIELEIEKLGTLRTEIIES